MESDVGGCCIKDSDVNIREVNADSSNDCNKVIETSGDDLYRVGVKELKTSIEKKDITHKTCSLMDSCKEELTSITEDSTLNHSDTLFNTVNDGVLSGRKSPIGEKQCMKEKLDFQDMIVSCEKEDCMETEKNQKNGIEIKIHNGIETESSSELSSSPTLILNSINNSTANQYLDEKEFCIVNNIENDSKEKDICMSGMDQNIDGMDVKEKLDLCENVININGISKPIDFDIDSKKVCPTTSLISKSDMNDQNNIDDNIKIFKTGSDSSDNNDGVPTVNKCIEKDTIGVDVSTLSTEKETACTSSQNLSLISKLDLETKAVKDQGNMNFKNDLSIANTETPSETHLVDEIEKQEPNLVNENVRFAPPTSSKIETLVPNLVKKIIITEQHLVSETDLKTSHLDDKTDIVVPDLVQQIVTPVANLSDESDIAINFVDKIGINENHLVDDISIPEPHFVDNKVITPPYDLVEERERLACNTVDKNGTLASNLVKEIDTTTPHLVSEIDVKIPHLDNKIDISVPHLVQQSLTSGTHLADGNDATLHMVDKIDQETNPLGNISTPEPNLVDEIETIAPNISDEIETPTSNIDNESETPAPNIDNESETPAPNIIKEFETPVSNIVDQFETPVQDLIEMAQAQLPNFIDNFETSESKLEDEINATPNSVDEINTSVPPLADEIGTTAPILVDEIDASASDLVEIDTLAPHLVDAIGTSLPQSKDSIEASVPELIDSIGTSAVYLLDEVNTSAPHPLDEYTIEEIGCEQKIVDLGKPAPEEDGNFETSNFEENDDSKEKLCKAEFDQTDSINFSENSAQSVSTLKCSMLEERKVAFLKVVPLENGNGIWGMNELRYALADRGSVLLRLCAAPEAADEGIVDGPLADFEAVLLDESFEFTNMENNLDSENKSSHIDYSMKDELNTNVVSHEEEDEEDPLEFSRYSSFMESQNELSHMEEKQDTPQKFNQVFMDSNDAAPHTVPKRSNSCSLEETLARMKMIKSKSLLADFQSGIRRRGRPPLALSGITPKWPKKAKNYNFSPELIEANIALNRDFEMKCQQYRDFENMNPVNRTDKDSLNRFRDLLLPCDQCDSVFLKKSLLLNHRKTVHRFLKKCVFCNEIVKCRGRHGMNFHILKFHGNERTYNCKHCKQKFKLSSQLKRHMIQIHEFLDNSFSSSESESEACGSDRNQKEENYNNLQKRMSDENSEYDESEDEEGEQNESGSVNNIILKSRLRSRTVEMSPRIGEKRNDISEAESDKSTEHDSELDKLESNKFFCSKCDKGFSHSFKLKCHESKMHPRRSKLVRNESDDDEDDQDVDESLECRYCHRECRNKEQYLLHIENHKKRGETLTNKSNVTEDGGANSNSSQISRALQRLQTSDNFICSNLVAPTRRLTGGDNVSQDSRVSSDDEESIDIKKKVVKMATAKHSQKKSSNSKVVKNEDIIDDDDVEDDDDEDNVETKDQPVTKSPFITRKGRMYHCKKCNINFKREKSVKYHLKKMHETLYPFRGCPHCSRIFMSSGPYIRHLKEHNSRKCPRPECKARYRNIRLLKKHQKNAHPNFPYRCVRCVALYEKESKLLEHNKIHEAGYESKSPEPKDLRNESESDDEQENKSLPQHRRTRCSNISYKEEDVDEYIRRNRRRNRFSPKKDNSLRKARSSLEAARSSHKPERSLLQNERSLRNERSSSRNERSLLRPEKSLQTSKSSIQNERSSSRTEQSSSRTEQFSSQTRSSSQTARSSSQTGRSSSQTGRSSSQTGRSSTQTGRSSTQTGRSYLQPEQSSSQSDRSSSQTERSSSQAERSSSQNERSLSRTERSLPRSERSSMGRESNTAKRKVFSEEKSADHLNSLGKMTESSSYSNEGKRKRFRSEFESDRKKTPSTNEEIDKKKLTNHSINDTERNSEYKDIVKLCDTNIPEENSFPDELDEYVNAEIDDPFDNNSIEIEEKLFRAFSAAKRKSEFLPTASSHNSFLPPSFPAAAFRGMSQSEFLAFKPKRKYVRKVPLKKKIDMTWTASVKHQFFTKKGTRRKYKIPERRKSDGLEGNIPLTDIPDIGLEQGVAVDVVRRVAESLLTKQAPKKINSISNSQIPYSASFSSREESRSSFDGGSSHGDESHVDNSGTQSNAHLNDGTPAKVLRFDSF